MKITILAAVLALLPLSAAAQSGIEKVELEAVSLTPNANLAGVSSAFLQGTFDTEGLYAAHARMDPGAAFPPHTHPDVRMTVVTSGIMYLGEGETFDADALVAYPVGTVAITPPGIYHFMAAGEEPATMLEIGAGPSETLLPTN